MFKARISKTGISFDFRVSDFEFLIPGFVYFLSRSFRAMELTWLGHATWLLKTGSHTILVDPFLDDSPAAPVKSGQVEANFILVSHGHADHIADCAKIAKR